MSSGARRRPRLLTWVCASLVLTAFAFAPLAAHGNSGALATLTAASQLLRDRFDDVQRRSGMAVDLQERLDNDIGDVHSGMRPYWMNDAMYSDYTHDTAVLDASLVEQLATGAYHELGGVRGADDLPFRSPADGTMQPVAVYVPMSYVPGRPTPLVVFLHGRTWTENDVLAAQPVVRDAAARHGAIIIAPYARGDTDYVDPAPADVYAALDSAERAFDIDCNRVYLAGHSMGGYGVFAVGTRHPEKWAAIFAAAGAMNRNVERTALGSLTTVPVFVVWGSQDEYAPPLYFQQVVSEMKTAGIDARGYEEAGGRHAIVTIRRSFDRAWDDMLMLWRRGRHGC